MDGPGIGPVREAWVELVCVGASGEVVDVYGPYRGVGVHGEAGASCHARSEAACGHVEEDRRPYGGSSQEVTVVLVQVFAWEVPGEGVHERGETFCACGVKSGRAREGKGSVFRVREPKDDHVRKGSSDHVETRGTAHGEMQANVHVEMGGPFPARVLCRKGQGRHVPWLHDG